MYDYELKLFAGMPLFLKSVGLLYPFTIKDIAEKGETNYHLFLSLISVDKDSFDNPNAINDITNFEMMLLALMSNETYLDVLIDSLTFVFKKDILFDAKNMCFKIGRNKILDANNFDEFVNLIKLLNCIIDTETYLTSKQLASASDVVKSYLKKRNEANEKVLKQKKAKSTQNNEDLTMTDLVSIFIIGNGNISYEEVWQLPIYAFNTLFSRMYAFQEFNINIQALLNGGKNIKIKNWMGKLKQN